MSATSTPAANPTLSAELPRHWGVLQRWKNTCIYWSIRISLGALRLWPSRLLTFLAPPLGRLAYHTARRERRLGVQHIALAFPEKSAVQQDRLVRAMFRHLALCAMEAVHLDRLMTGLRLDHQARATLDDALEDPDCQGVVAVAGHIGNWELLAQMIATSGYDVSSIAKPLYDPRLTRLSDSWRRQTGQHIIYRGGMAAARQMMRVFRRNAILGLLIDQDTKVQSVFAPFFGTPAATPAAAGELALRMNARVVVAWHRREGKHHKFMVETVDISPAWRAAGKQKHGDEFDAAVVELTGLLNQKLEQAIRLAPEQWVWLHRRWKTRPSSLGS